MGTQSHGSDERLIAGLSKEGSGSTAKGDPVRRAIALLTLAAGLTGCGTTSFSSQDMRLYTRGDTLYVFARSEGVSRSICSSLGGDIVLAEARYAASEGRMLQLARVRGCHTIRHVIVCAEDDLACVAHEEQHRSDGVFHP